MIAIQHDSTISHIAFSGDIGSALREAATWLDEHPVNLWELTMSTDDDDERYVHLYYYATDPAPAPKAKKASK